VAACRDQLFIPSNSATALSLGLYPSGMEYNEQADTARSKNELGHSVCVQDRRHQAHMGMGG
jgi:hypothetical protein